MYSSALCLTLIALTNPLSAQQLYDYKTGGNNLNKASNNQEHYNSQVWSTIIGASLFFKQDYQGDNNYQLKVAPVLTIGQYGFGPRFISHNDNMSFSFIETNSFRLGLNGKILGKRDNDQFDDVQGLRKVKWGGEIGGFVELYPIANLRIRTELRHGLRTHNAFTADFSMDIFNNISPTVQVSAGPRAFYATKDYFNTYYGVDASASAGSHLAEYSGHDSFGSVGLGGEIAWKTTDKLTTSFYGEYRRLTGSAADSSLVNSRGDKDQFTFGVSTNFRFDENGR